MFQEYTYLYSVIVESILGIYSKKKNVIYWHNFHQQRTPISIFSQTSDVDYNELPAI